MNIENLFTLKIHKLSQAQYDRELEAGRIDENALYLTPYENNIVDSTDCVTKEYVDNAIASLSEHYDFFEATYYNTTKVNIADCCDKYNYLEAKMDMELANSIPSISLDGGYSLGVFANNLDWMQSSIPMDKYVKTVIDEFENMKANGVFTSDLVFVALGNSKKEVTSIICVARNPYGGGFTHRISVYWSEDDLSGDVTWDNDTQTIYTNSIRRKYIDANLSNSNFYADAKVVGDRLAELESNMEAYVDNAIALAIGGVENGTY